MVMRRRRRDAESADGSVDAAQVGHEVGKKQADLKGECACVACEGEDSKESLDLGGFIAQCEKTIPFATFEQVSATRRWAYFADPLIRRGYRLCARKRDVIFGLFSLHNETVNIWSHLLGVILFATLAIATLITTASVGSAGSIVPSAAANANATGFDDVWANSNSRMFFPAPLSIISSLNLEERMDFVRSSFDELRKSYGPVLLPAVLVPYRLTAAEALDEAKVRFAANVRDMRDRVAAARNKTMDEMKRVWTSAHSEISETMKAMRARVNAVKERISLSANDTSYAEGVLASMGSELESLRASWKKFAAANIEESISENIEDVPMWPVYVFFLGAIIMLGMSTIYHAFAGYDKCTCEACLKGDLAGISFMILGSFVPTAYYSFYCSPIARVVYITGMSVLCAITLVFTFFSYETLQKRSYVVARVASYVGAGAFGGVVPLFHIALEYGVLSDEMFAFVGNGNLFLMGLFYLGGAALYASRWPESKYRGYDIFGSSHQLWHLCVLAAAIVHHFSTMSQYRWRKETSPFCAPPLVVN